jgi:adenylyl cyclase-associated protein
MRSLIAYIKQYYSGGITWNPEGVSVSEAIREVEATANGHAPSTGGPPPPPPLPTHLLSSGGPPPPPLPAKAQPGNDMGAVFGEAITSGLKKVDQSQMTHKNPALRGSAPVPERSNSGASLKSIPPHTKPKPESMRTKKPPKMVLERSKWLIENFDSPTKPVEVKADVHHSILISKCRNATIRVSGKCNAISIDSSSKLSVIVDTLVSSVDVIKCPSFAIQVLGSVPTVLLDQVDGAAVYLGGGSLATEVLTSKCTAVNVYFPHAGGDEDDYKESNVPEQFRSVIRDGRLVTEILQHS